MKLFGMSVILFSGVLSTSTQAQMINLATTEHATVTTVFGYNDGSDLSAFGTEYEQYVGAKQTLNDGTTGIDGSNATTFGNQGGTTGTSYGFGGYENLVVPTGTAITSINLFQYAFGDGGWFGPNADYNYATPLGAKDLSEPLIQATTDDGTTWTTLSLSNPQAYLDTYSGKIHGGQGNLPEVTFNLAAPLSTINGAAVDGIRIIGLNGGYAGTGGANGTSGFMSITELQVEAEAVPEPSTYTLLMAGFVLVGFCARRKLALR